MNLVEKIFGTHSEREIRMIMPKVKAIEELRPQMVAMSDDELRAQTEKFRARLAEGETLDDILPEAFATVREAARRFMYLCIFAASPCRRGCAAPPCCGPAAAGPADRARG